MKSYAPNLIDRAYLMRPTAALAATPLCTFAELRTVLTLDDLADFHEALDLHEAAAEWAQDEAEQRRTANKGRRR